MRIQAAITISVLFFATAWGSCAGEGVEHPSKNDAGQPAEGGEDGREPPPAETGETGTPKPSVDKEAPAKAK